MTRHLFQVMVCGLLAIGFLAGGSAFAGEAKTTIWMRPSTEISEGAFLIDRGEIAKGVAVTKKAIEEGDLHYADLAAAYNNLCTANLAMKLYREARELCSDAIRLRPFMWQAYNNRANAYFGLGQWDEAIADYNRAVDIRPDMDVLAFNLYLAMERKRLGGTPSATEQDG